MEHTTVLKEQMISHYRAELVEQEKSANTIEKYIRDIYCFFRFVKENNENMIVTKQLVICFKETLQHRYCISSVNSMLVALNGFLKFVGCRECCVRLLKCQRRIFREEEKELTKDEYFRLLEAARKNNKKRLMLVIETICSTGIRISELQYITVAAVKRGFAEISCKGKHRKVFLPSELRRQLKDYINQQDTKSSYVFQTKGGKPLDRSNIWKEMKALCKDAEIKGSKVFPHNLRHVFARTFYEVEKDIVRLADILGHSSIETSRIYTISCGQKCAEQIERMGLAILLSKKRTT